MYNKYIFSIPQLVFRYKAKDLSAPLVYKGGSMEELLCINRSYRKELPIFPLNLRPQQPWVVLSSAGALPYRPAAGQTAEWRQPGYEPAWHAVLPRLERKRNNVPLPAPDMQLYSRFRKVPGNCCNREKTRTETQRSVVTDMDTGTKGLGSSFLVFEEDCFATLSVYRSCSVYYENGLNVIVSDADRCIITMLLDSTVNPR
jgi:hypothetical protein